MLRATPNRLRLLTRHALHQPLMPLGPQQLRAAAASHSPMCASLRRLSQPPQRRSFHSTQARLSDKKPSFFTRAVAAWKKGLEEDRIAREKSKIPVWGIASYEPIPDAEQFRSVVFGIPALVAVAYWFYLEVSSRLPVRSNPNHLLNESLEIVNKDPVVTSHLGTPIAGQGERIHWWHQVETVKIVEQDARPSRLRIKYYLTGPKGNATVFAEVVEGTSAGEYNYLVVQVDDTKEVVAIIDHREAGDHKAGHDLKPKDHGASDKLAIRQLMANDNTGGKK